MTLSEPERAAIALSIATLRTRIATLQRALVTLVGLTDAPAQPTPPPATAAAPHAFAPAAAAQPPRARRHKARALDRDQVARLNGAGLDDKAIARELQCSPFSVRNIRQALKLPSHTVAARRGGPSPEPAPAPSESGVERVHSAAALVHFLRTRGDQVAELEPARAWQINQRTKLDRAGLLDRANRQRARLKLAPFAWEYANE